MAKMANKQKMFKQRKSSFNLLLSSAKNIVLHFAPGASNESQQSATKNRASLIRRCLQPRVYPASGNSSVHASNRLSPRVRGTSGSWPCDATRDSHSTLFQSAHRRRVTLPFSLTTWKMSALWLVHWHRDCKFEEGSKRMEVPCSFVESIVK